MPRWAARKDVDGRAARDERRGFLRRAAVFEQPEPAGPPRALEVQIGAVREQDVEQRQVLLRLRRGPAVEVTDGLVHRGPDVRVLVQQVADFSHVAGIQRVEKLLHRRFHQRFDLALHRRPVREPVPAGDDELRVRERQRVERGRLRVQGANAGQRAGIGGQGAAEQLFRALLLRFEARPRRKWLDKLGSRHVLPSLPDLPDLPDPRPTRPTRPRRSPLTAHRSLADAARGLARTSSLDGRITSSAIAE